MAILEGKRVVVTGGCGLLGRAFCKAIAAEGGEPIVADIDLAAARSLAVEIDLETGRSCALPARLDITSLESIRILLSEFSSGGKTIDALVNSAYPRNASYGKRLEDVDYEGFCDNVSRHLGGYFLISKEFALHFKRQGFGNIITISSIYGVIAPRFEIYDDTTMTMPVEYAAIKAGLQHLMRYFVKYFKGCHIRFNCLSPGGIKDRQPESFQEKYRQYAQSRGMLEPKDLTGSLVFLLSDLSEWVNGQNLIIDDGWSL